MASDNIKYTVSVSTGSAKANIESLVGSINNLVKAFDVLHQKAAKAISFSGLETSVEKALQSLSKMGAEMSAINESFKT